jgi:hypothetical protein
MKFKKTSINFPIDTYIELNREAKVLGIPLSSLILIKLNELKKQKESKDLLIELLSNNNIKQLIDIYNNEHNNQ